MNRYILSMATVAMLFAACQKDEITEDLTLGGDSAVVERQIVISGTSAEVTRGYVSDDSSSFTYIWDAEQQFALSLADGFLSTDGSTTSISPVTVTPSETALTATLATTLSLAEETIAASSEVISIGPLTEENEDDIFTATLPAEFETGSAIPTDYLYVQGKTTTADEATKYDELNLSIVHTLVPAIVKLELSSSSISKVVLTASSAIFPLTATLDGVNTQTSDLTTTITIVNDKAGTADVLYALLFPTIFDNDTITITAYVGDTVQTLAGDTLEANKYGLGTSFDGSQAYVIPITLAEPITEYTVTFDGLGTTTMVAEGGSLTQPDDPTVDGYFMGWFTDNTYTTEYDFETSVINDDTTIYALIWSTDATSYSISSLSQLETFRDIVNDGNYTADATLTDDIDFGSENATSWTPIGRTGDNTDVYYSGTFNGNNRKISNLYLYNTATTANYYGFFGNIAGATIKDLTLEDATVYGYDYLGGIVGNVATSTSTNTISNCHLTGSTTVSGHLYVGGILGHSDEELLTISGCSVGSSVKVSNRGTQNYVAGIAGAIIGTATEKVIVENCTNEGTVTGTNQSTAGIAAWAEYAIIRGCSNSGTISTASGKNRVSGILTSAGAGVEIYDSYNSGAISGQSMVGGIVGISNAATDSAIIVGCYNDGTITGSNGYVGGVVGYVNVGSTIAGCYNTGAVISSGTTASSTGAGGIVGGNLAVVAEFLSCYNTGAISGTTHGELAGSMAIAGATFANSYWVGDGLSAFGLNGGEVSLDTCAEVAAASDLNDKVGDLNAYLGTAEYPYYFVAGDTIPAIVSGVLSSGSATGSMDSEQIDTTVITW